MAPEGQYTCMEMVVSDNRESHNDTTNTTVDDTTDTLQRQQ